MQTKTIFGLDIGGSGIKGAIVDVGTGELLTERKKVSTPQPSTPEAVAGAVKELLVQFDYNGDIMGCGFPSIVKHGVSHSAANIDPGWMGVNIQELLSKSTGKKVFATNDADAAGLAEMRYGKGHGLKGTVLLVTIGTGLGSALFTNGHLVPNTEFGHCNIHGMIAEAYVSNTARKKYNLTWDEFGKRFNEFLEHVERLCSPDLVILGGGISNDYSLFSAHLNIEAPVTTAMMFNHAGIIGAALYAYEMVAGELIAENRP